MLQVYPSLDLFNRFLFLKVFKCVLFDSNLMYYFISILFGTIQVWANEWTMLKIIISDT